LVTGKFRNELDYLKRAFVAEVDMSKKQMETQVQVLLSKIKDIKQ